MSHGGISLVIAAILPALPLSTAACKGKLAQGECAQMLDRYIEMTVAADPALADLSADDARASRDAKKAERKTTPSYARAEQQCEAEISQREYRCAMKAPSPETWQACID